MSSPAIQMIEFVGTKVALVREEQVQLHLDLDNALSDLEAAFRALGEKQAINQPRIRIDWQSDRESSDRKYRGYAWLHTLRAGLMESGLMGGKDYTSLGFDVPAMWVTVLDARTGKPIAFIEADYLSRVRTAATAALATDLLAPRNASCLAHFGAGKISELLIRAVLKVRPSIKQVLLVRRSVEKGPPEWLSCLSEGMSGRLVDPSRALEELKEAEIVTTATSSRDPVIPEGSDLPFLRHLNLIGANHQKRREIDENLARRCLPKLGGYLVVEDVKQAEMEAGDFASLADSGELVWNEVPTLAQLLVDEKGEREKAEKAKLTAFKSVGIGLMDLAVAAGVLRRLGLLP